VVVRQVYREEKLKATAATRRLYSNSRRLLTSRDAILDSGARQKLDELFRHSDALETVYEFRQKLQRIWQEKSASYEKLLEVLQEWCRQAEATGIQALQEFAVKLRGYSLQPV
jgi:stearoyl-CoA desaturase (delta-9 desaturase)